MLIFLYGEDVFRSQEKLKEIENKFLAGKHSASGFSVIDFEDGEKKKKFREIVASVDLFSPQRLIVVKNILSEGTTADQEDVMDFLEKSKSLVEGKDIVIVFWESSAPGKNNKLFSSLLKKSRKQEFAALRGSNLARWVAERIKKEGAKFSKPATELLIAYVGNDLYHLDNEIKKLSAYKKGDTVEEKDVEILVKSKIEADIFETIDALANGDKKEAFAKLHKQLEAGEDPFYIFSMYVYQLRNLMKVGEFYWQGRNNQYEIAKTAKLHPFVVGKSLRQLRNFTREKLIRAYQKLENLDLKIKTGKMDINLALDKFVVEI